MQIRPRTPYRFHLVKTTKWKLIEHFETNAIELYDLERDVGESESLTHEFQDKAAMLKRELADWRSRMNALMPSVPNPKYIGNSRALQSLR